MIYYCIILLFYCYIMFGNCTSANDNGPAKFRKSMIKKSMVRRCRPTHNVRLSRAHAQPPQTGFSCSRIAPWRSLPDALISSKNPDNY